jgi:hypothetical protein
MADNREGDQAPPSPDPALDRLSRFVGTWSLKGRPLGSSRDSITGTTTFAWLHGAEGASFFLQQDMEMDYDGMPIKSHEIIGYDEETKAFSSFVYSNMAPDPWPYAWDVRGDDIIISIKYGPMDATFRGAFAADGNSWSGSWRPNPGADEAINAPYDVIVTRVE